MVFKPMIRPAAFSDSSYEPYTAKRLSIFLASAGTVFGGTLDLTTGTLTVDRVGVKAGDLTWVTSSVANTFIASNGFPVSPETHPASDTFVGETSYGYTKTYYNRNYNGSGDREISWRSPGTTSQKGIADGITGSGYVGDALGTFTGSFYNNTTTNTITGALLTAIGKVAETSGYCEIGWPLSLSTPLAVSEDGTGANTAVGACNAIGAVKKAGDAMTGDLTIITQVNPGLVLQPYYNDTTNLGKVEGTYAGSCSIAAWDDSTGNNRRALEVRDKTLESSLNNAALLRVTDGGSTSYYRLYHEGQSFGIPVGKGGTGSTTAAGARTNLGCDDASNLSTGTVEMARLPFKVAFGSGNVAGNSALSIDYSSAGFTAVPCVVCSYSTTGSWAGDNGALKIYGKSATGATIIVGGNFNTARSVDWVAIGY